MGVLCSKQSPAAASNPYAGGRITKQYQQVEESIEKATGLSPRYKNSSDDEFYDGIPRYQRTSYRKSQSFRASKVSEVSSLLGRAGSAGLGTAVKVLDTLGSSVSSFNKKGGFVSGAAAKTNELCILAFEVANTIVKGSNLMQSLSSRSIRHLKEVVLLAEGVQQLISNDLDELLRIVADDKRAELKVFAEEVIRFGNRCKDPQWHNLDRFFEKRSKDRTPQAQLRETAESVMLQIMASVQLTAELYQELHILGRLEEDFQHKRLELRFNSSQSGDRDNSVNILSAEVKNQKKVVKNLKKRSLWSRSMEEVMEKLVDIVLFLNQEINYTFGNPVECGTEEKEVINNQKKLGRAALALHYANIILQIDSIVARSNPLPPPNSRDTLYESLPPNLKRSLRTRMQSFCVEMELTPTEIKDEMEKTLHWLVVVATNTAKAHYGFGWVGEWANTTGSEMNRRTVGPIHVMLIETLHYADKQKTEAYILDLLLWLNYLVTQSQVHVHKSRAVRPSIGSTSKKSDQMHIEENTSNSSATLIKQNQEVQQELSARNSGSEENISEKLDNSEVASTEAQLFGKEK